MVVQTSSFKSRGWVKNHGMDVILVHVTWHVGEKTMETFLILIFTNIANQFYDGCVINSLESDRNYKIILTTNYNESFIYE